MFIVSITDKMNHVRSAAPLITSETDTLRITRVSIECTALHETIETAVTSPRTDRSLLQRRGSCTFQLA